MTLLLDVSGSMKGQRLEAARAMASVFIWATQVESGRRQV